MSFANIKKRVFARGRERVRHARHASATEVALLFDSASEEAVFALPVGLDLPQLFRVPAQNLKSAIAEALTSVSLDPTEDLAAQFLSVAPAFTEDTRSLPLNWHELPAEDTDLLISEMVERQRESSPEDEAHLFPEVVFDPSHTWDVAVTPSGDLTITSVARTSLDEAASRIVEEALSDERASDDEMYLDFRCETLVRATLRAVLHDQREDKASASTSNEASGEQHLVTAIILFTSRGAVTGLWSPSRGLTMEDAEPFSTDEEEYDTEFLSNAITHALDNLLLRLSPASLAQYGFEGVQSVLWTASPQLIPQVLTTVALFETEYAARNPKGSASKISRQINEPLEEIAVRGLLLGAIDAEVNHSIPPINLADALMERAQAKIEEREERSRREERERKRGVKLAALLPITFCVGLLIGGYLSAWFESYMLAAELRVETEEKERLAPVAERRRAAADALKWVNAYLTQVTELRRRQPAPLGLLAALDERYPVSEDPTFTVKLLQAQSDGSILLQGLTKKDDAISALITRLEYSPTDQAGRKLFEHPVMELRKPQVGGINLPNLPATAAMTPTASVQQRADVTAWTLRAIYTPLQQQSVLTPAKGGPSSPASATSAPQTPQGQMPSPQSPPPPPALPKPPEK